MSNIQNKPYLISPFCIYHYNDKNTNTYHGFIGNPTKIRTSDGKERLECHKLSKKYGLWKIHGVFYAISPLVRPIPNGLKLINAKKLYQYPYNTKKVSHKYNPFNIDETNVNFLTWTTPVAETVRLYLYKTPNGDTFPTFDKNPPEKNGNWKELRLSPLFVLVDYSKYFYADKYQISKNPIGKDGIPVFKFKKNQNRCIPSTEGITLEECFLQGEQSNKHSSKTLNLLDLIEHKEKQEKNNNIQYFFKHIPPFIIITIFSIFFIALIYCIISLSNK